MSEKRPETSADIITRSRVVRGRGVLGAPEGHRRKGYNVDLPSHMAECDANYHRLSRIFPQVKQANAKQVNPRKVTEPMTLVLPDMDAMVCFEVLEQSPYTTLLEVRTEPGKRWLAWAQAPKFTVRAYHDAKSAEVVSYQNRDRFHGKYEYPNTHMRQRDEKAQINRLLSEFLNLCLEQGAVDELVRFER